MDAVAEIGWNPVSMQSTRFSLSVENERTDAERDGRTRLVRANSQARTGQEKKCFPCSADHEQDYLMYCTVVGHELMDVPAMSRLVGTNVVVPRSFQGKERRHASKSSTKQGQPRFDAGEQGGIAREEDDASSQRSGLLALLFFISLLALVLAYVGTIFAWYAVSACCACTVATSFGGWDTLELWWSGFSLENFAKSKHD